VDNGSGAILPTWTAVDNGNVKTSRELWGFMKNEGWNVDVSANYLLTKVIILIVSFSTIGKYLIESIIYASITRPDQLEFLFLQIDLSKTTTLMPIYALFVKQIPPKRL